MADSAEPEVTSLYVGNVDWEATSEEVGAVVERFGVTTRVALRRGCAFVTFAKAADAKVCIDEWNAKQGKGTGEFMLRDRELFIAPQKSKSKQTDAEAEAKRAAVATAKYARKKKRRREKRTGAHACCALSLLSVAPPPSARSRRRCCHAARCA